MKLDRNYKVPEGFEPVLNYRNDKVKGEPIVGQARLVLAAPQQPLEFWVDDPPEPPALPLKGYGGLWHKGWDIPTRWAIDALGRCWMDNAHGGSLSQVEDQQLLNNCEKEAYRAHVRELLGMPPEGPSWMAAARAAGWRPPRE